MCAGCVDEDEAGGILAYVYIRVLCGVELRPTTFDDE